MRVLAIVGAILAMLVVMFLMFVLGALSASLKGLQEALDYVDVLDRNDFDGNELEKMQYTAGWIDACRFIIDFKRGQNGND